MDFVKKLQLGLSFEVALLLGVVALIHSLSPAEASYFRLYELFGALSAAIITTFGLYKMRDLT